MDLFAFSTGLYASPFIVFFILYLIGYIFHGRKVSCRSQRRLDGKTVIITGGSSGIGRAVAIDLASRGARVIIASRQEIKGQVAAQEIRGLTNNSEVTYYQLNLADSNSVRDFAAQIYKNEKRLDVLINNAAIADHPYRCTEDGYEAVFGTNYIGHFSLTYLLIDLMKATGGRIVNVSSLSHTFVTQPMDFTVNKERFGTVLYPNLEGYEISKLALVIHAKELARRYSDYGILANSCHPGFALTPLWKSTERYYGKIVYALIKAFMWALFVKVEDAAQTVIHCALCEEMDHITGKFIKNCRPSRESKHAQDPGVGEQLWDITLFLAGITPGTSPEELLRRRINPELERNTAKKLEWWQIPGVNVKEEDPTESLLITRA